MKYKSMLHIRNGKNRMISINTIQPSELEKIRVASAYLFSLDHAKDDSFIENLNLSTIKKAFRIKAKRYHPDHHLDAEPGEFEKRKERFVRVEEAYRVLRSYVPKTDLIPGKTTKPEPRIIAVGGAKGGIGKSIFSANLAVYLAGCGKKTVAVDLDLGGANLHLYLGKTFLKWNINDFLNKRVSALEDILVPSKYGPLLIGGDSSHLGASNIGFARKLKLVRAIKEMNADYIILDLGGDTSFNVIDFFLMADQGVVLTTCDPASYLEAYNFIKVALFRKLSRIFGAESELRKKKDILLERLIEKFTQSPNGSRFKKIDQLIAEVGRKYIHHVHLLQEVISGFSPSLLVNRVSNRCDAPQVVKRLQDVSQEMLSINLRYLGSLPQQTEIEASVRNLIPMITSHPHSMFAQTMHVLTNGLIMDHGIYNQNY
jgi:flagellar biosynthesis protein FlhG